MFRIQDLFNIIFQLKRRNRTQHLNVLLMNLSPLMFDCFYPLLAILWDKSLTDISTVKIFEVSKIHVLHVLFYPQMKI